MRNSILLFLLLIIGGYTRIYGQCVNEKGYDDFPFTENGITVTKTLTGGFTSYPSSYLSCTVPTKANSVYTGNAGIGTFRTDFSIALNDINYNITGANTTEAFTVTVSNGSPSISFVAGSCPAAWTISGNVLTCTDDTYASGNAGGRIMIHSTVPYTWIKFETNGVAGGSLFTLCFDAAYESVKPTVTTTAITSITGNSASSGGDVTTDGGAAVTAKGVCWNTTGTPVATGNHTSDGTGTGSFTSSITGLSTATNYYVRAYATNTNGTAYGSELSFTTSSNPVPANLTSISANFNILCNGASAILTANGVVGTVYWYTGSCGGTATSPATGNTLTVTPSETTTYYARNYNNSQYSAGCASINIVVNPKPTVANLQANGTGIKWYLTSTGGVALLTSAPLINNTHYWASQTVNGVESTTRLDVYVTMSNPYP